MTTTVLPVLLATLAVVVAASLAVLGSPAAAHAKTKTVRASMYGGPNDPGCSSTLAASKAGRLRKGRNIIAMRTHRFGDLWKISYKRHGKWRSQLFVNLDYGPAKWTGKKVDIGWGGAKRIWFPGVGKIKIKKVGHLPKSKWRKFTKYKNLAECKRKLHFK
jgi:hypothetical protein